LLNVLLTCSAQKRENLDSHIDMHTHTSSTFDNCVTLTFDFLISRSMHATEQLPWAVCLPSLVLIAQAVFLLEHGRTDPQTDRHRQTHTQSQVQLVTLPIHQLLLAWVITVQPICPMNVVLYVYTYINLYLQISLCCGLQPGVSKRQQSVM